MSETELFVVTVNQYGEAAYALFSNQTSLDQFKVENPDYTFLPCLDRVIAISLCSLLRTNLLPTKTLPDTMAKIRDESTDKNGFIDVEAFIDSYGKHIPSNDQ